MNQGPAPLRCGAVGSSPSMGEVFMHAAAAPGRVEEQFLDARPRVDVAAGGTAGGVTSAAAPAPADPHTLWIAAVARGDQRAFEAFYDATLARVVALVRRICADSGLAEEVVEDAYVQVWRDAGRYDTTRGVPLAWLLTIARSRALDALRRRDEAQPMEAPEVLIEQPDESADPLDLLTVFEETSATRRALEQLPARERQLIGLAFLRGMTHAEIAAETGWPLGTIKTSIRRALGTMRAVLLEHAPAAARLALVGGTDEFAN